ncbi:hypothetical protein S2M10_17950 [Sphingomonas sp. S2M10]|uniref:hypothetical protein n=1 Tax=Sphingomonas sp. S2M10 TaxID=2705010 RepID=UPI00145740E0|nr:hypothetical protein [Sphingomonas sp. S2M10]NLS26808.1 hypothetical protein [Sphingomonas sp. S2M10]
MLIVYMFIALAGLCCAVAAVNGGWEGRWAGGLTMLTILAGRAVGTFDLQLATSPEFKLCLDGALLAAFAAIMLRSRRWWPIWLVGLQGNAVLAHVSGIMIPSHTAIIYRGLESFWGIPMVLVLATGPLLDRAVKLATNQGSDGGRGDGTTSSSACARPDAGG